MDIAQIKRHAYTVTMINASHSSHRAEQMQAMHLLDHGIIIHHSGNHGNPTTIKEKAKSKANTKEKAKRAKAKKVKAKAKAKASIKANTRVRVNGKRITHTPQHQNQDMIQMRNVSLASTMSPEIGGARIQTTASMAVMQKE